jgi:predicted nucleotidyltransferase component of viral defense system
MKEYEKHEVYEIETLELLNSDRLLEPLVFGGGTMLRLCYDLKRYSVDLDFWIIKNVDVSKYFKKLKESLSQKNELTDSYNKHFSLLCEIRSPDYPKRLKLEIRKKIIDHDYQQGIAYSRFSNTQVALRTHTLNQTMRNKVSAFIDRGAIRDAFDIEFLLRRGIEFPSVNKLELETILKKLKSFKAREFKVTLGSVIEQDLRNYYIENRFKFLESILNN